MQGFWLQPTAWGLVGQDVTCKDSGRRTIIGISPLDVHRPYDKQQESRDSDTSIRTSSIAPHRIRAMASTYDVHENITGGCLCGKIRYEISFPAAASWPPEVSPQFICLRMYLPRILRKFAFAVPHLPVYPMQETDGRPDRTFLDRRPEERNMESWG